MSSSDQDDGMPAQDTGVLDGDALETVEAQRLSEAIDALDEGRDPGIDAIEDPSLSSDLQVVHALRQAWSAVEPRATYRERARALILGAMRPDSAVPRVEALPAVVGSAPAAAPPLSFLRRWRGVLTPIASAAAAAAVTVAVFVVSDEPAPAGSPLLVASDVPVEESVGRIAQPADTPIASTQDLTSTSVVAELQRIESALRQIEERALAGTPVEAPLLRAVTESNATVASLIDNEPEAVNEQSVITYFLGASAAQALLTGLGAAEGAEGALVAAQRSTQDGIEAAEDYLVRSIEAAIAARDASASETSD